MLQTKLDRLENEGENCRFFHYKNLYIRQLEDINEELTNEKDFLKKSGEVNKENCRLNTQVNNLQGKNQDLNEQIETLKQTIEGHQTEMTKIQAKVNGKLIADIKFDYGKRICKIFESLNR